MMFVTKRQRMAGWQTILILIKISQVTNKVFKATANVDLFPDLKLIWHLIVPILRTLRTVWCYNGVYNPRSYDTGIFSISTVLIKTSFRLVMKIHLQHLVILDQTDWQWQIDWHHNA
jgi:hypothetical protein